MSAPVCKYCGSVAPYGDERNLWIGAHEHRLRKAYGKLREFWRKIRRSAS